MLLKKTDARRGMRQFRPGRNCRRVGDGGLSTWRGSDFKSGRGWVRSLSAFKAGKALRINDRESDLFLGIDLLIMDASSIEMFKRELLWCYDHPGATPEPLAFTFRDFMRGIDAIHASEQYAKDKAFWQGRAAAIPPAPQLPVLKDTTAAKTAVFKRLSLTLSSDQTARLRALATANGISLSSAICTAYALALSAYANQPRCTLNVTIFNKYDFHPDVARMMGDFTSTMLLPFNFADNPTIKTA